MTKTARTIGAAFSAAVLPTGGKVTPRALRVFMLLSHPAVEQGGRVAGQMIEVTRSNNPSDWQQWLLEVADQAFPPCGGDSLRELTEYERALVNFLLVDIACGKDVREALQIDPLKVGHRPSKMAYRLAVAREVRKRVAEGDDLKGAIADVAEITGRPVTSVQKDWQLLQPKKKKG